MGFGFESISHWLHFHAWCTLILALLLYNKIGNRVKHTDHLVCSCSLVLLQIHYYHIISMLKNIIGIIWY